MLNYVGKMENRNYCKWLYSYKNEVVSRENMPFSNLILDPYCSVK